MGQPRLRTILIATGATIALVAGSTTAYAAVAGGPVDSSGVIHGCWTNAAINGTHVVVLQDAGTTCPKGTTAISWNQQGPAGAAGAAGPEGPQGDTGAQGPAGPAGTTGPQGPKGDPGAAGAPGTGATVAAEPAGNNCANGGASITGGSGNTAYACTGATGPAGPQGDTGPQGLQGLTGSSGVEIDAGWLEIAQDGSGNFECIGACVGPDAGSVQFNAMANGFNSSEEVCVISGFPTLAIPVSVNPGGFATPGSPQPFVSFSQPGLVDCPGSFTGQGGCIMVAVPLSAFQQVSFVEYFWQAMQTAPSAGSMNSAAAQRTEQAARRMAALARTRHG